MKNEKISIPITRKFVSYAIFFTALLSSFVLYKAFTPTSLPLARERKMVGEIERIQTKTFEPKLCVQYALVVLVEGWFVCYNGEIPTIYLKRGEVWKYGKTCLGQDKRYPNGLPDDRLIFKVEFTGTEEQCLIIEKQKIYNYYLLPENIERAARSGTKPLVRPPGNKIDR